MRDIPDAGLGRYERGATPIFSYARDPRFGYCLYVPSGFEESRSDFDLVVTVHGTARSLTHYRDKFADFARFTDHVVLAPLFPIGPLGDDNAHGYKVLREGKLRYDHILLGMVAEVAGRLKTSFEKFKLFGFSGGGQFAHRFSLLHPERLDAVSMGAPGSLTLLDNSKPWFVGTGDCATLLGKAVDVPAVRAVPAQIIVGAVDLDSSDIMYPQTSVQYVEGINDSGTTRVERAQSLYDMYRNNGIPARLDLVKGAAHDVDKVIPTVQDFFRDVKKRVHNDA